MFQCSFLQLQFDFTAARSPPIISNPIVQALLEALRHNSRVLVMNLNENPAISDEARRLSTPNPPVKALRFHVQPSTGQKGDPGALGSEQGGLEPIVQVEIPVGSRFLWFCSCTCGHSLDLEIWQHEEA